MYIDITGIQLNPGENGTNCEGNGTSYDKNGNLIECSCDECDFFLICFPEYSE